LLTRPGQPTSDKLGVYASAPGHVRYLSIPELAAPPMGPRSTDCNA
jgi:hypothetical protein